MVNREEGILKDDPRLRLDVDYGRLIITGVDGRKKGTEGLVHPSYTPRAELYFKIISDWFAQSTSTSETRRSGDHSQA